MELRGEDGLLPGLDLGLTVGEGLLGNKLLMLNFPMGEYCAGENELTGLDIGGMILFDADADEEDELKLPFTSASNDPRMEELPSVVDVEPASLLSDLLPALLSLLPLAAEPGSTLA